MPLVVRARRSCDTFPLGLTIKASEPRLGNGCSDLDCFPSDLSSMAISIERFGVRRSRRLFFGVLFLVFSRYWWRWLGGRSLHSGYGWRRISEVVLNFPGFTLVLLQSGIMGWCSCLRLHWICIVFGRVIANGTLGRGCLAPQGMGCLLSVGVSLGCRV